MNLVDETPELHRRQFLTMLAAGAATVGSPIWRTLGSSSDTIAAHGNNPIFGNLPMGSVPYSRYVMLEAGDVINDSRFRVEIAGRGRVPFGPSRFLRFETKWDARRNRMVPEFMSGLNITVYTTAILQCLNTIPRCDFFNNALVPDGAGSQNWRGWMTGSISQWAICYTDRGMIGVPNMPPGSNVRKSATAPR